MGWAAPAIGLGSSIVGGIQGKGAAKRQEKLARDQMAEEKRRYDQAWGAYQPIMEQAAGSGKRFLQGAEAGIGDLQKFWKPLVGGDRAAIDQFLMPERQAINEGWQATQQNIARMAPRGGGRVSALAGANVKRQGALNDLVFGARKEGANQLRGLSELMGSLGTSNTQGAMSSLAALATGAGNRQSNATMNAMDMYGQRSQGLGQLGSSLGGFLADIFKGKGSGGPTIGPILQGDTGAGNPF